MTTQEKIINVATQEFLNSGYLGASLRKIAKAAHVTTGAMYGYYKNKEALFNDIVEEVSEEFKNDFDDKLSHIINHSYLFGVFEIVRHQMTEKQAEDFVSDLQEFYQAGWNKLLERKEI